MTEAALDADRGRRLLKRLGAVVDEALEQYLPPASRVPENIHAAMRYAVLAPGKRFRPVLLLAAAESLGVPRERALPGACALEFIHAFSLIHDDLPAMDDDDLRRGRPASHKEFGEAVAILAGDALSALAFEILVRETPSGLPVGALVLELARAVGTDGMIGGQVLDLLGEGRSPDGELVREIHLRKTAALIRAACVMAALLAGAGPGIQAALLRFGESLGLAFQIVDDLLDETSSLAVMGKRTGKDRERGKQTWPHCFGLAASRSEVGHLIQSAREAIKGVVPKSSALEALADSLLARVS